MRADEKTPGGLQQLQVVGLKITNLEVVCGSSLI